MSLKGKLIVIEGLEGAGKSTVINKLKKRYGDKILFTREPGGTEFGEELREQLLNKELDPITKLFLFEAARREHFVNVLFPALEEGKLVIMDRFTDSTIAYQGFLENIGMNYIQNCNTLATAYTNLQLLNVHHVAPDLTIFLDVEFKTAQKRIRKRENNNMLDRLSMEEWDKVKNGYHFAFEQRDRTGKVVKIDTTELKEGEVITKVASTISEFLKKEKEYPKPNTEETIMETLRTTKLKPEED